VSLPSSSISSLRISGSPWQPAHWPWRASTWCWRDQHVRPLRPKAWNSSFAHSFASDPRRTSCFKVVRMRGIAPGCTNPGRLLGSSNPCDSTQLGGFSRPFTTHQACAGRTRLHLRRWTSRSTIAQWDKAWIHVPRRSTGRGLSGDLCLPIIPCPLILRQPLGDHFPQLRLEIHSARLPIAGQTSEQNWLPWWWPQGLALCQLLAVFSWAQGDSGSHRPQPRLTPPASAPSPASGFFFWTSSSQARTGEGP